MPTAPAGSPPRLIGNGRATVLSIRGKGSDDTKKCIKRSNIKPEHAKKYMQKTQFFMDFERVMPGLIDSLAMVATRQWVKRGEVVFRQGDPPVDCYAVLSGKVGVYQSKTEQDSPREPVQSQQNLEATEAKTCWGRFLASLRDTTDDPLLFVGQRRMWTTEGHNTYTAESKIGNKVVELKENVVFGELALLENLPRAATIKCLDDCEFLVIAKSDFHQMFGTDVNKVKISLFVDNVPGFREWADENVIKTRLDTDGRRVAQMDAHPCDLFQKGSIEAGHCFWREGQTVEPQIILIEFGEVEYHKQSFEFPRKTPLVATACWENPAKPSVMQPVKQMQKPLGRTDTVWHKLGPGALFSSLPIFDLPCAEPFSVIASKTCQVYILKGKDLRKLSPNIRFAIERHMVATLRPILWHSPAVRSYFSLPRDFAPPGQVLEDVDDDGILS